MCGNIFHPPVLVDIVSYTHHVTVKPVPVYLGTGMVAVFAKTKKSALSLAGLSSVVFAYGTTGVPLA